MSKVCASYPESLVFLLLPCYMRHLVATTVAILAALATLSSCTVPTYNLDAIVIHGQPEVVDILSAAVTRLGGTVTQAGHAVDTDAQQAYCVNTSTTSTLAVTTGRNIHVCDAWTKAPTAMRRRSLWHELGHLASVDRALRGNVYEVIDLTHATFLDKNPESVDAAGVEATVGTSREGGDVEGDAVTCDSVGT